MKHGMRPTTLPSIIRVGWSGGERLFLPARFEDFLIALRYAFE
jgi:hypothetical protein